MASASINDIKSRIKSVQNTGQITKAMELVATSKLRRAREKVENTHPYHEILKKIICDINGFLKTSASIWTRTADSGKMLYVVIAGDRGLAGGYNANVFRLATSLVADEDTVFLPIGKKALEFFHHRKLDVFSDDYPIVSEIGVGESLYMANLICEAYRTGKIRGVKIIYTKFISMLSQTAVHETLLPFVDKKKNCSLTEPRLEEEAEEMLDKMVPEYIGGVIYSALCEALASESGARRSAMNAANKNAEEMLDTLMLQFNRARQAVITQEITEIVSGAQG